MMAQHGDALRADAGRETTIFLRVVTAVAQHDRMHHAAAHDLQPAAAFTHRAALAAAQKTLHVHFGARLGEREVGGAEAGADVLPEHAAGKISDRALQIAEGDVMPNRHHLQLVELDVLAGVDLLVAEAHARQDDAHRRRIVGIGRRELPHGANLTRRGVRAQDEGVVAPLAGANEERILHIAGGMIGWEVEQLEVVLVRLDLARAVDLEAHLTEDAEHLL